MRITPSSPRFLWYWHRFMQKKLRLWTTIVLPQSERLQIRLLGEGRHNLVMEIAGEECLLRILRIQYYDLSQPLQTEETIENCRYMNSLADFEISPRCEHIVGGASRVEHAGNLIAPGMISSRAVIDDIFSRIRRWSLQTGIVIVDYNEGNWCLRDGHLQFVDFDTQYTCLMSELKTNKVICKRIDTTRLEEPEAILEAFLEVEAGLLWDFLQGIELPPS